MKLTLKIKLLPTIEQEQLIKATMQEYLVTVNGVVANMVKEDKVKKYSSKEICAQLPSAVKSQCALDGVSIFQKYRKTRREAEYWNKKNADKEPVIATIPILRKPIAVWNNQNYKICDSIVAIPVLVNGKSKRIKINAIITPEIGNALQNNKLGTLRITYKSNKLIAQIAIEQVETKANGNGVMGIDLGLKCPAVCVTGTNKVLFVGNGRQNKYIRRQFRTKRKELGKAKKVKAIKKIEDKEQRIMKDIDHKISRKIVDFAVENKVGTIRMEKLANIRKTAKTSRKNEKNLHTWSFYRLAQFIEYKASLVGITMEYVNPAYTSQSCPICGERHHAKDRTYKCKCGYVGHRDKVGAINIINAPVMSGKSSSAQGAIRSAL